MEPLAQPQIDPQDPIQPVVPNSTPTSTTTVVAVDTTPDTHEDPSRILDIIRAVATEKPAAPSAGERAAANAPYLVPETLTPPAISAPEPEHIPTLAELGGNIGTPQQKTTTVDEFLQNHKNTEEPLHPRAPMEVYTTNLPHEVSVTSADLEATDKARSPLAGIAMDSIKIETGEPKAPQTFSTSLTPERAPVEEMPATPPKGNPDFIIPSVHTLRDDMKSVVRDQSLSIVRASALEEQKKQARAQVAAAGTGENSAPRKRQGSGIIVAILAFFVLGGVLAGGFWWYRTVQQAPIGAQTDTSSIIFAEQSIAFPLANSSPSVLKRSLGSARSEGSASPSSITRVVPTVATDTSIGGTSTTHLASASEFFTAIGAQLPAELMSAIGPDIFVGIHAIEGNQALFIIPVTSYEHAFAGMLSWEGIMSDGLSPFFEPVPATLMATDGSIAQNTFKDIVIKNYDVRLQSDAAGNPKLLYSFPNRDTLIITSNPYTLIETLARLQAARKL